jgi:hypothetical protein
VLFQPGHVTLWGEPTPLASHPAVATTVLECNKKPTLVVQTLWGHDSNMFRLFKQGFSGFLHQLLSNLIKQNNNYQTTAIFNIQLQPKPGMHLTK